MYYEQCEYKESKSNAPQSIQYIQYVETKLKKEPFFNCKGWRERGIKRTVLLHKPEKNKIQKKTETVGLVRKKWFIVKQNELI